MRKLLLLGTMMVPLLIGQAKADIVWHVNDTENILSDNARLFTISGTFTTNDLGDTFLSSALTVTNSSAPMQPGAGDFNTDDGASITNFMAGDLYINDSIGSDVLHISFSSTPDGTVNPDAFTLIEFDWLTNPGFDGRNDYFFDVGYASVPEPTSMALLAFALAGLTYVRRRSFH